MKRRLFAFSAVLAALMISIGAVSARDDVHEGNATVRAISGDVQFRTGGQPGKKLRVNATLPPGVEIVTGADSHADISVNGLSSTLRVDPGTTLEIQKMSFIGNQRTGDRETLLNLKEGEIFGNVKKISGNSRYEIHTPHGMAAIRGTDFFIRVAPATRGDPIVTFASITGQVICTAEVDGIAQTQIVDMGEIWTPGAGALSPLEPGMIPVLVTECGSPPPLPRPNWNPNASWPGHGLGASPR